MTSKIASNYGRRKEGGHGDEEVLTHLQREERIGPKSGGWERADAGARDTST